MKAMITNLSKIYFATSFSTVCLAASCLFAVTPKLPPWDQVKQIADQQLNSAADYQSGDLISRRQVDPVFDMLMRAGWNVKNRSEILNLVCSDNDPMVRQFRTASGKQFMRQISKSQLGYDRVDQIEHLRGGQTLGQSTIDLLIATPGGYKNILNLGKSSPKQISSWMLAPGWQNLNFNSSTGRIYTADAFMARLRQSYDNALAGN
jgi:hypothetical protein